MKKNDQPTARKEEKMYTYAGSGRCAGQPGQMDLPNISVGPVAPYCAHITLVGMIEHQVRLTPNNDAIRSGDQCLTYIRTDRLANGLAHKLRNAGIHKGDPVPLLFDNSLAYPVAVLALMKLGTIFIPLDIDWGAHRLANALESLAPKLVLTNQTALDGYPCRHIDLEGLEACAQAPETHISQGDPIYGFFTSGSTGTPKCALNIHKGIVNRFLDMTRRYGVRPTDRVLVNSKLAFDSTLWQLLWPLTLGITTVLPRPWRRYDLSETIRLIDRHQITMTDFVPSMFNLLADELARYPENVQRIGSLRQILIGGEEINFKSVAGFKKLLPHVGLANTYGVTECSMGMVFYQIGDDPTEPVPIGRPIDNTFVVILDQHRQPVRVGEGGELYLGGDCLGAGYLNEPQKTQAAFVSNPFKQLPGDRLYRTGDFGYLSPEGHLHYIGRRDQQVQVNGNRVELGEIEAVLNRHPDVKQAKVVVLTQNRRNQTLAAALVTSRQMTREILKSFLAAHLPAYMHPRRFLFLPELPLTANGKVDSAQLCRMLAPSLPKTDPVCDTRLDPEQQLAAIWQELLAVEEVLPESNFFELGADSILTIDLLAAIEETFGLRLALSDLMQAGTFSAMCRLVTGPHHPCRREDSRSSRLSAMVADLALADDISCRHISEPATFSFDNILLTGATGFVGAHLLAELLQHTQARIFCPVRACDAAGARQRIDANLRRYQLSASPWADRIVALAGDLTQPRLGFKDNQYDELRDTIDTIIHNGAMVNFAYSYDQHRTVNVLGTMELLELAATGSPKRFHYVSTLGVFPLRKTCRQGRLTTENCLPDPQKTPHGGYYQSKTVAERLVAAVRSRGINATIFRLGEVMPHSANGIPNPKALSTLLLNAFFTLGVFPGSDRPMDYTPVDYAVRAMIEIARQPEWLGANFHICHPEGISINTFMAYLGIDACRCRRSGLSQFNEALARELTARPHGMMRALAFFIQAARSKTARPDQTEPDLYDDLFMTTMASICQRKTHRALAGSPIRSPRIDAEVASPYGAYLAANSSAAVMP